MNFVCVKCDRIFRSKKEYDQHILKCVGTITKDELVNIQIDEILKAI